MYFPPDDDSPHAGAPDAGALDAQQLTLLAPEPVIEYIQERHALDCHPLRELIFFCTNSKMIWAAAPPMDLPRGPALDRVGISLLRIDMVTPRLATPAAMAFGTWATTNVVDLPHDLCEAYLSREAVDLSPSQWRRCSGRGHVIVRHDGHALGMGFLESTRPEDDNQGRLRSLYPGAWSSELEQVSPFGNPL